MMIEMGESQQTTVQKKEGTDRKHNTNCYDCEVVLTMEQIKIDPNKDGDKRYFCLKHWKKRFGKKKKLIKRY